MSSIVIQAVALLFATGLTIQTMHAQHRFLAPPTPVRPVSDTVHGLTLTDPYRWLEDKNNPEVINWTRQQHEATEEYINRNYAPIAGLREEISAFLDRDITYPPFYKATREFFYRKKKGMAHYVLYTRIAKKEIVVFDVNALDSTGKTSTSGMSFTRSGDKVAIGIQHKGTEITDYRIIDTQTGKQIGKELPGVNWLSWCKDEHFCYIGKKTKETIERQEPPKVYLHKFGDDLEKAQVIAAETDAKNIISVSDAEDADITLFYNGDFYSSTLKIRKTGTKAEPKTIYSSKEFSASPYFKKDRIFILTNHNAPNFKIMSARLNQPEFEHWQDLVPEKETVIESFEITSDYLLVQDKKDVMSRLMVYDLQGHFIKQLELPEFGNVSGMSYHKESNTVYVSISTFTAPSKQYKLDGKTLKWTFVFQDKPPVDLSETEAKIVFYPSKDGTRIPMFLIHKKGLKLDGTNPTVLNGYGGFNVGISPSYLGYVASFVNRGGVYAIAGIRGGNEYGEKWHRDGMLDKKQNVFDDFIAGAEFLVRERYTNTQKLAIDGGSNGGLLVGAVATQRPDLCALVMCGVPLLDMIRYHKFLIARFWIPEYGSADESKDFANLLRYSPYHNIRMGVNLPTMLVSAGENDSRVDPLHAKKFVAALQNNIGQANPVMLHIDYDSGHGSGKSTQRYIDDYEFEWRFIMRFLGM